MPNMINTDALADKLHEELGLKTEMGREYLRAILPLAQLMDRGGRVSRFNAKFAGFTAKK